MISIITMNGEMMQLLLGLNRIFILSFLAIGCGQMKYNKTVENVELEKFMGDWYVIAGRVTFLEEGAFNPLENYKYNKEKQIIEVTFTFNKNGLNGDQKLTLKKATLLIRNLMLIGR